MIINSVVLITIFAFVEGSKIIGKENYEDKRFVLIRDIIDSSDDRKGWSNFLIIGNWPNTFFNKMQGLPLTFITVNGSSDEFTVEDHLRNLAKILMIECRDFEEFETKFDIARDNPYWHPHSNTIVFDHNATENNEIIAKIFFGLWYHKSINAIILQYNNDSANLMITYYSPFISEHNMFKHTYGCWTQKKITLAVENLKDGTVCTQGCQNVTLHSKLRGERLGTCIGFETVTITFDDRKKLQQKNLFEDKAKNLHGYALRAYTTKVMPFLMIDENEDGTYTLHQRDGFMWSTMANTMNFKIDLTPSVKVINAKFDFEVSIQQIYSVAHRKGDLLLFPVYQFDLIIVAVDMTIPFKDSGVCFMSHRADFETALFDAKVLRSSYTELITFAFGVLGIWFVFFAYNIVEKEKISGDQAGKDLVNTIRNILSISLYKPPKKPSFRIFLLITIWSFFLINFATQAAITSFFSAFKRGREVETFDDIIEKGYVVEGMSSPDIMLPETEEKFKKINAKLVGIRDLFGCVKHMSNDSRRFCLIDCAVGRYLEHNLLNEKGEQYLHIGKDQVHSNYLNMIFYKDSPFTDEYNKNMLIFLQAGLVNKWEQYRFSDIKNETPVKALDMTGLVGVFKCYIFMTALSTCAFVVELIIPTRLTRKLLKKFKKMSVRRRRPELGNVR